MLVGVFDDLLLEKNTESRLCLPNGISGGQIIESVSKHLRRQVWSDERPDRILGIVLEF